MDDIQSQVLTILGLLRIGNIRRIICAGMDSSCSMCPSIILDVRRCEGIRGNFQQDASFHISKRYVNEDPNASFHISKRYVNEDPAAVEQLKSIFKISI